MSALRRQHSQAAVVLAMLMTTVLGVAMAAAPAVKKEKEEEKIPAVLLEPRYDVPAGARDPFQPSAFLTGIVPPEETAAGKAGTGRAQVAQPVAPKGAPTPEEICRTLSVQAVFGTGGGGSSAILNGQLAKAGDSLRVMVRGQAYEVAVRKVDLGNSSVTVAYQDSETVISVRNAKKGTP